MDYRAEEILLCIANEKAIPWANLFRQDKIDAGVGGIALYGLGYKSGTTRGNVCMFYVDPALVQS